MYYTVSWITLYNARLLWLTLILTNLWVWLHTLHEVNTRKILDWTIAENGKGQASYVVSGAKRPSCGSILVTKGRDISKLEFDTKDIDVNTLQEIKNYNINSHIFIHFLRLKKQWMAPRRWRKRGRGHFFALGKVKIALNVLWARATSFETGHTIHEEL